MKIGENSLFTFSGFFSIENRVKIIIKLVVMENHKIMHA